MLMCFYKNPTITPHLTVGKCPRTAFSKDGTRACRSQATDLAKGHHSGLAETPEDNMFVRITAHHRG